MCQPINHSNVKNESFFQKIKNQSKTKPKRIQMDRTQIEKLSRKELQALAKERGIKANAKSRVLVEKLVMWFEQNKENETNTTETRESIEKKQKRETSNEGDEKKHHKKSEDIQFIERALVHQADEDLDEIYYAIMRECRAFNPDSRVDTMNDYCSWLDIASCAGHVKIVNLLIKSGDDVNDVQCLEKKSALHYAAWSGGAEVAKVLIQNGAYVNAVDEKEGKSTSSRMLLWTN